MGRLQQGAVIDHRPALHLLDDEARVTAAWLGHRGHGATGMTAVFFSTAPSNLERARAICVACPVRQECYEYAMADPDLVGMFGGFTAKERREMRRAVA